MSKNLDQNLDYLHEEEKKKEHKPTLMNDLHKAFKGAYK